MLSKRAYRTKVDCSDDQRSDDQDITGNNVSFTVCTACNRTWDGGGTQIYTKWQQLPGNIPVSHSDSISTTEPTEFVNDHDSVACVRNARFLPRDAMHSADYAVARCLSVCPSVRHTPVFCLNGHTYPQFFSSSGSPTILVFFHTERDDNIPTGPPPLTGWNACGMKKNHDFRPISCFISEMMQDRAIVTMEGD